MPTDLDIRADDPEEYQGRLVRIGETPYVIGPLVGEGGERIVHALTNCRSALSLHLIAILRDQDNAPNRSLNMIGAYAQLREVGIPTSDDPGLINAHGGWFELIESMDEVIDPLKEDMRAARAAFDAGDLDSCASTCQTILDENEDHTEALMLKARVAARQDNLDDAIEMAFGVLSIEPNHRVYRFFLLEWLAAVGYAPIFLGLWEDLKARWPGERRIDHLAAEVLMAVGRVADAQNLYSTPVPSGDWSEPRPIVVHDTGPGTMVPRELQRRARRRASRRMQAAGVAQRLSRGERAARRARTDVDRAARDVIVAPDKALRSLESAHRNHPTDPHIAANYGFALLRSKQYNRAIGILENTIFALQRLPRDAALTALVVALTATEEYERAAGILKTLVSGLTRPDGGIDYFDLPAVPVWAEESGELIEKPATMEPTVERLANEMRTRNGEASAWLDELVDAYRGTPSQDVPALSRREVRRD